MVVRYPNGKRIKYNGMGKTRGMHGNERNVCMVLARKGTGITITEPKFGRTKDIEYWP